MSPADERALTSWGRSMRTRSRVHPVSRDDEVRTALAAAGPRGTIARGLARSYGDACLNDGGDVLEFTGLDGAIVLDEQRGAVECDAGVSYRQLMPRLLPAGWLPPVCPGTAFVTMGGALANDVHGKNQHGAGSFGDHVEWFDLLLPDGELRRVTRESDAELFAATVGGIGLTGVIVRLRLRLMRVPSNGIRLEQRRVPCLEAFFDALDDGVARAPYVVGWMDTMARGPAAGRGILELAEHIPDPAPQPRGFNVPVPMEAPAWALSRLTMRPFNSAYYHRVPAGGRVRTLDANPFLYPLDALLDWNRLYGPRGIHQFQCVVPPGEARRAIPHIVAEARRLEDSAFLSVIKAPGRAGSGLLSFLVPGVSLALDFPARPSTPAMLQRLHELTIDAGGRVYLAKDSCLSAANFRRMYPDVERFLAIRARVDPTGRLRSDMGRRLGLCP